MTKLKKQEFEEFYIREKETLVSKLNDKFHNEVCSEEIVHSALLKCMTFGSKWGSADNITLDYVFNICEAILTEADKESKFVSESLLIFRDPLDMITEKENLENIYLIIDNMRTYGPVLRLYLIEGYSVSEIAIILNMKSNTVSKHVSRGLSKLKEKIESSKHFQFLF